MKTLSLSLLLALITHASLQATSPQVRFTLAVHSEVAGGGSNGVPVTPNFTTTNKSSYLKWREAIITLANLCAARGLAWQFQSDYNFLEGVRRFEVAGGANYDAQIAAGTRFDAGLGGTTTNTGGKNVMKYLRENLGVNLDPHSHESNVNYNYADIAWLIDIGCDTEATLVAGGHVYTGNGYQDWPKFIEDRDGDGLSNGLRSVQHTDYFWRPHLLMGGGTAAHRDDPHNSGLWRPQDAANYFEDSPTGQIAAVANWEQDFFETDRLLRMLEDGTLPHNDKLWTVGRVMNHRDLVQPGYLTGTAPAILDTIKAWRDAGRFEVKTYEAIYTEWLAAPFNGQSSLYLRPSDNVTFSLNWQEFCRTSRSNDELRTLLNHHENMQVPVDVFLTTWQTDILEDESPELLGRLLSSRWVNLAYHIRAPKPYANGVNWRSYTSADVTTYENSQLDMVTGQPVSGVSGGFGKLTTLYGAAPQLVGPNSGDATAKNAVYPYFYGAGVRMIVQHDDNGAVNFGSTWSSSGMSLNIRPESYDWRLIEYYEPERAQSPPASSLPDAFTLARSASGAVAPYFVGVKLHDNDLIATESAWVSIYVHSRRTPNWAPSNQSLWATELAASECERRRAFYTGVITDAASRRATINLMDARDTLSMLGEDTARPLALSRTEVTEGSAINSVLAEISGGSTESGLVCVYELVNGTGSEDNSAFTISGSNLLAAQVLSSSQAVRHLRIRWTDGGGNTGERALTLVVSNADDDGDGFTEIEEIAAGTNPRDATSRLAVTFSQMVGRTMTLTWSSVIGKTYHIEWSADLMGWSTVPGVAITASDSITSTNLTDVSGSTMFFRVAVD